MIEETVVVFCNLGAREDVDDHSIASDRDEAEDADCETQETVPKWIHRWKLIPERTNERKRYCSHTLSRFRRKSISYNIYCTRILLSVSFIGYLPVWINHMQHVGRHHVDDGLVGGAIGGHLPAPCLQRGDARARVQTGDCHRYTTSICLA